MECMEWFIDEISSIQHFFHTQNQQPLNICSYALFDRHVQKSKVNVVRQGQRPLRSSFKKYEIVESMAQFNQYVISPRPSYLG